MSKPQAQQKRSRFPKYSIVCSTCEASFDGRFFSQGWCGGKIRYCDYCPNLKLGRHSSCPEGPETCECGGRFNSHELRCPGCGEIIPDAVSQLAAQHYSISPAKDSENPTTDEIAAFVDKIHAARDLFIQLRKSLSFDEQSQEWRWYEPFAL